MTVETKTASKRLTQAQHRERTRRLLLDAAARVFAERGFQGASVDVIAEEAGFTKGAVYWNFGSKEELIIAVLEHHCDQQLGEIERMLSQPLPLEERLRRIAEEFIGDEEHHRTSALLFTEMRLQTIRNPEITPRYAEFYEIMRERVAELLDTEAARSGLEMPADTNQLAAVVIAMADGLIMQQLAGPSQVRPDTYALALQLIFGLAR